MATDDERRVAKVAQLNDDAYVAELACEAWQETWQDRTSTFLSEQALYRLVDSTLMHIEGSARAGRADTQPTGPDAPNTIRTVDVLLGLDDSTGAVREQMRVYANILITSVRVDRAHDPAISARFNARLETYNSIIELDGKDPGKASGIIY